MLDNTHHSSDQTPMTPRCLCTCRSIWPSGKFSRLQGRCVRPRTVLLDNNSSLHASNRPLCDLSTCHLSVWNSWNNLHLLPCSEDRDTILYCHHRYDTSSSSGRIFALYLWSTMWQIRREEDTETAKLSSRIQMREKMDQVNVTGSSFVTQWCVSHTAWDVSRDRKWP